MKVLTLVKQNIPSLVTTLCCCLAFQAKGFQAGITGPSLYDFQVLTNTSDISLVTWIVTARGTGVMFGALLTSGISSFVNMQILLATALLGSGVSFLMTQQTSSLSVVIACFSAGGVCQGIIDASGNMLMIQIWASKCSPFLQLIHLNYGTGCFLAPILVGFFLLPEVNEHNFSSFDASDVRLMQPFLFVSILPIVVAGLLVLTYFKYPCGEITAKGVESNPENVINASGRTFARSTSLLDPRSISVSPGKVCSSSGQVSTRKTVIIILSLILMCIYGGVEQVVGSYIPVYAVESSLKLDQSTGAIVSCLYWASITVFQGVSIFLISTFGVTKVLWIDLFNAIAASVILLSLVFFSSPNPIIFWVAMSYLGCSFSSIFGAVLSYLEINIKVTPFVVSLESFTSCLGLSLFTAVVGSVIDRKPDVFIYYVIASTTSMLVVFYVIHILCGEYRRQGQKDQRTPDSAKTSG